MNLTICGSIAFIDEMDALRVELEALGHSVKLPPLEKIGPGGKIISSSEYYEHKKAAGTDLTHWIWQRHSECIQNHFRKIEWADAVVIANHNKNNIENYIGPNTLMEMSLAYYLHKPIFLLNPIPVIAYFEEIVGMNPIVINGDLSLIPN